MKVGTRVKFQCGDFQCGDFHCGDFHCGTFTAEPSLRKPHCGAPARKLPFSMEAEKDNFRAGDPQ